MKKSNGEWVESGEYCPKCKQQTDHFIETYSDEEEYITKERCNQCKWEIEL